MAGERGLFFYIFFDVICFYLCYCFFFDAVVGFVERRQTKYSTQGRIVFADDRGLFFHVFVSVAVFVSYFDFAVGGQNLLGR